MVDSTLPTSSPVPSRPPEELVPENGAARWGPRDSEQHYQVTGWGFPYFSVNDAGHVAVRPNPDLDRRIDLFVLAEDLKARGLELPILVRFPEIIAHRIRRINESFAKAIAEHGYTAQYRGVYPVKVNQQRHVVDHVLESGKPWNFGLEVGSKPELLIALAATQESGGLLICNGYKDLNYIETALIAQHFEKTVLIVLERVEELDIVFRASERLGIRPRLGVRAKLSSKGKGRWEDSSGDHAKFGLTTAEIVTLVDRLAQRETLDTLELLHFHIGSQVSSIIPIKNALQEAANVYVELVKMGCKMGFLDVGGGLAIDYDGSKSDFHASRNYTLAEYAADVVTTVQDACRKATVAEPVIISESGRAVVAHQSVLVFEAVSANKITAEEPVEPPPGAHGVLQVLYETYQRVLPKNVQESWHDAMQAKEEAQNLFKYGYMGLREMAQAERLFWSCCNKIEETARRLKFVPEELHDLEKVMAAIYYCNFSIFQSVPDSWAIDQLFPVMPIHRLNERPGVRATLADVTCDSDGVIDHFIDVEDVRRTLDVHRLVAGEPYMLGLFLNGAYQEILGDLHNLFGDTNAVHVTASDYGYRVEHVIKGDSMNEVLRYVSHDPESMLEAVRAQAERALGDGKMTVREMRLLMRHYEQALGSYTYLTDDE